jgi:polysaccharide biosynthesis transport protein
MDTRIRSANDIESALPCRTLGTVPDITLKANRRSSRLAPTGTAAEFLAHGDPDSPIYEAMRNVHSSIFLSAFGRQTRCMSVSSSLPGEGKTLIGVSLATVLSLDKSKNVLVVDADLRRPRIHKVFGLRETGPGLTTLVKEQKKDWSGIIHSAKVERLFYLTSGPIPEDPVSVLRSEGMRDLVASLKQAFDYVIIDSPPVLGFPDALLLGYIADGTVLVVEESVARSEEIKEAYRALSVDGRARVLGVILNKTRPQPRWYGGYYYRGYSYGYGKHYSSS